ncbi:MAG: radical SAM family heme chaperone HemW [Pseudomonadota bacterium]
MSIPLALYIHIPWCAKKCPYCDFNSHAVKAPIPEAEYVAALLRDLDHELRDAPEQRRLTSIFFGGGTPSLFSGAAIGRILDGVAARLAFAADIEITLEANPGTAEAGHFKGYRDAGVNRLSMGVQSLDDRQLRALGRIHGADEARAAVAMARAAGFDNLNLDLMFALPSQTVAEAAQDLCALIALAPQHISYYHLTLEPNTAFAARPPPLPDSDSAYEMLEAGQQQLAAAGYAQYETSAYAQPGRSAQHNLNYWRFGDYLGIGAGAHGKRTFADRVERRARHKHPKTFMETAGSAESLQELRTVAGEELAFEYCLNALRLHEGFARADFEARTGLPFSLLEPRLEKQRLKGLIDMDGTRVWPTPLGRDHLNTLLTELL